MGFDYRLIKDAYHGSGGFDTGCYLTKHTREDNEQYADRQEVAYYLNYFAPIVNALVNPIFKKSAVRESNNKLIKQFIEDVDCGKATISELLKKAALKAKMFEVAFIVIDNFNQLPEYMSEVHSNRLMPYAYIVDPDKVVDFKVDRAGCLISFTLKDVPDKDDKVNTITFTRMGYKVQKDGGEVISQGEYKLGRVPVVPLFNTPPLEHSILPPPSMLPIAKTAKYIYNACSWLGQIFKNQAFSILTIPSKIDKGFNIGTNNAICFDGEVSKHAPSFISPASGPAETLSDHIKMLVSEMYRQTGLSFVTGTNTESSGYSKQWDFETTNQTLADFANAIQQAEYDMIEIFCLWQGIKADYQVDYPDDFGVQDIATEIEKAQAILDLGYGPEVQKEVLKRIIAAVFPDLPDERVEEIIKEFEKTVTDKNNAEPIGIGDGE